jgi:predicted AlkP superfamily pyrophosphatase or phosphodiesterase
MKRSISLLLLLLIFQLGVIAQEAVPGKNVILIGWDGAQREHLQQCLKKNELPNLEKMISKGVMVNITVKGVTDTKAGWSQILTGYSPEITGVYSNKKYKPIPVGYSIFERLKQFYGKDFKTVAVIGKKDHVGNAPPKRIKADKIDILMADSLLNIPNRQRTPADREKLRTLVKKYGKEASRDNLVKEGEEYYFQIPGKPYYYTSQNMDTFINGLVTNELVTRTALKLLKKYNGSKFFFFIHFAEIDENGHKFGENSEEYNKAMISCDKYTGKIMDALKKMKLEERTIVYVTADHGFDEGMKVHKNAPYIFLVTNDLSVKKEGSRADITPTILNRLGVDLSKIQPPLSGVPLNMKGTGE